MRLDSKLLRRISWGALALTGSLVAITLFVVIGGRSPAVACSGDQLISGEAKIGGPFELVNSAGRTVSDRDVIVEPSLVYFGFASCPEVCPLDNARNAAAIELLAELDVAAQTVFISIDPERDSPQVMAEYSPMFHERMISLTGTPEQVRAAASAYRVYYSRRPLTKSGNYMMDHSTFTYLVLPKKGVGDFFRREDTPEQIADNVACHARASGHS